MKKLIVCMLSCLLLISICASEDCFEDLEDQFNIKPPTSVPEPSTYALVGLTGLIWFGVAGVRRFRK